MKYHHLSLGGIVYGTRYPTRAAAQAEADQRFVLTGKRWLVVDGQPQCEACRAFVTSNFKRCIWCGVVVDRRAVSP